MKLKKIKSLIYSITFCTISFSVTAQKDYKLWLQYEPKNNSEITTKYLNTIQGIVMLGNSETSRAALTELDLGLGNMLEHKIPHQTDTEGSNLIIIGNKSALDTSLL